MEKERYKYRVEIQQMMFVSGASNDPPLQTVCLMEDIVRSQVIELISRGTAIARKRGVRSLTVEDIMFLIRHDIAKVNRLSNYLAWKDVRKNAREQDGGGQGDAAAADILDDAVAVQDAAAAKKDRKQKVILPWKPQFMFSIPMVPNDNEDGGDTDDEDAEASLAMSERLRNADLRTRNMTREEYVHWSECRQASFTFRKSKKFREWCGMAYITEARLQDDIMDVLGFLTFEIVANLTEEALKIRDKWDKAGVNESGGAKSHQKGHGADASEHVNHLFHRPSAQETPLLPEHVRAAYIEYETPTPKDLAMRAFSRGRMPYPIRLI